MVKVKNTITSIDHMVGEDVVKMNYSDLLTLGINTPPEKGWTTDEMRMAIKVMDKLKKATNDSTIIELEDAEFNFAFDRILKNWGILNIDIVTFEDEMVAIKNKM